MNMSDIVDYINKERNILLVSRDVYKQKSAEWLQNMALPILEQIEKECKSLKINCSLSNNIINIGSVCISFDMTEVLNLPKGRIKGYCDLTLTLRSIFSIENISIVVNIKNSVSPHEIIINMDKVNYDLIIGIIQEQFQKIFVESLK